MDWVHSKGLRVENAIQLTSDGHGTFNGLATTNLDIDAYVELNKLIAADWWPNGL
jgi:hypothetical protein